MPELITLAPESLARLAEMLRRDGYRPINSPRPQRPEEAKSGARLIRLAKTATCSEHPDYPKRDANTYVAQLGAPQFTATPGEQSILFTAYSPAEYRIVHDPQPGRWLPKDTLIAIELAHGQWYVVESFPSQYELHGVAASGISAAAWNADDPYLENDACSEYTLGSGTVRIWRKDGSVYAPADYPDGTPETATWFNTSDQAVSANKFLTASLNADGEYIVTVEPCDGACDPSEDSWTPPPDPVLSIAETQAGGDTSGSATITNQQAASSGQLVFTWTYYYQYQSAMRLFASDAMITQIGSQWTIDPTYTDAQQKAAIETALSGWAVTATVTHDGNSWTAVLDASGLLASYPSPYLDELDGAAYPYEATVTTTNQIDSLAIAATGGTYALTVAGQTTAAIAYDASAATIQAAIVALAGQSSGDVTVTGSGPYSLEWTGTNEATAVTVTANGASLTTTATNEIQTITLTNCTGGTFTLTFGGYTTAAIAWNASTAAVQSALQALTSIGSGNVSVTGSAGAWVVEFTGSLAGTNQALITGDDTNLTNSW